MQEASASADYLHDDFGNGICTNSGRNPDQMRPRCGGVQEVDFPHDASVVARGARRTRGVAYTSFYLFGALGKNSLDGVFRFRWSPHANDTRPDGHHIIAVIFTRRGDRWRLYAPWGGGPYSWT